MICYQSLVLIHKMSNENKPPAITKYLYHSLHRTGVEGYVRKPSVAKICKTAVTKNSFMHRAVYMYCSIIPDTLRFNIGKKYKKELKVYIKEHFNIKNIPRMPD